MSCLMTSSEKGLLVSPERLQAPCRTVYKTL